MQYVDFKVFHFISFVGKFNHFRGVILVLCSWDTYELIYLFYDQQQNTIMKRYQGLLLLLLLCWLNTQDTVFLYLGSFT